MGATSPHFPKIATLKNILNLFEFGPEVIEGAYGNTALDKRAYLDVNIDPFRIYIVDGEGELTNAGNGSVTSYETLAQNVEEIYHSSLDDEGNETAVQFDN